MILDETKLASAVLDGEEEATPAQGDETPTALLDGEEEGAEKPAEGDSASPETTEGGEGEV